MPPKSWKPCRHCGQLFGPSSLERHESRCNARAEVAAERELRELEGFARPPPLADWQQCPNCGERYGSVAIGPHVKRCRRLRPHGANGFCHPEANVTGPPADSASGAEAFAGLWGVGDLEPFIRQLRDAAGIAEGDGWDKVRELFRKWDSDGNGVISEEELADVLRELCPHFSPEHIRALFQAADVNGDGSIDYEEFINFLAGKTSAKLSAEDLEALRALFNRFDEDANGLLTNEEFTNLMQNMMPSRANDFDVADLDQDGGIDFDEFVRYWQSVVGSPGFQAMLLDEAADMFQCFDKDGSGHLDPNEFLALLDNLFPDHCEENERHVAAEFSKCDADGSDKISFQEFLAYYERLLALYGRSQGWPPKNADARADSLNADFVCSPCGLKFLPDRLPVHIRSCDACKDIIRRKKKEGEEAALAKKRAEDEERARAEAEAARRKAEEDARARALAEAEEAARREAEAAAAAAAAAAEDAKRRAEEDAAARARAAKQAEDEARARAQAAEAARRRAEEEARRRALAEAEEAARRQAEEEERQRRERELNDNPHGFVPCEWCGRTFFPDRLPVHMRVCKKKPLSTHGIRPTMTPGETKPTIGRYQI